MYSTLDLDSSTLDVIANWFDSSTVKMLKCQKQEGCKDCGLFAIAYAMCWLTDSMDDDGTVVDRGPRRSGGLTESLDILKKCNRDILVEVQQQ